MVTSTFTIASGYHDGQGNGTGVFDAGGDTLYFTSYASKKLFMRFSNVTIPKGSIITDAHIYLFAYNWSGSYPVIGTKAYLNDVDDAVAPTNWSTLAGKVLTTAYADDDVYWGDNWRNFSGLASAVQEVVDRSGWASGNAMMVIFVPYEGAPSIWAGVGSADGSYPAKLHITYTPPAGGGQVRIIGEMM